MKHLGHQPGVLCLNHGWKFIEKDISILPTGLQHNHVYGFAKAGAAKGPAAAIFDDSDWQSVVLPHDWVTKKAFTPEASPNHGYKQRGIGWYRLKFNLEIQDMDRQILLEFEGMSCDAQIYCNGQLVKHNYSGYNSFCVDITDIANFGSVPNMLAVRIDASVWEGWWYEGAGIYRNVWMVKKAPVHIAYNGCFIKPIKKTEDTWLVEIEITVENSFEHLKNIIVDTELWDRSGELLETITTKGIVKGYETISIVQSVLIHRPKLWNTRTPYLYCGKVKLTYDNKEQDYLKTEFGFRTVRIDKDTGFWLNEENMKLQGFCNHQDHAGVGVAVPYAIKEYRVKLLKDLGANAYRCAHNTDPEILEICDRLGMVVMEENRTFSSEEENLDRVRKLVQNSRNRPSVILYSIFNEEPFQGTGKGRRIAGRLQAVVKSMDNTRPILGAFNGGYMEETGAATILEVVGINYNPSRYDDFHAKYPDTPIIGSETASAFMVRGEYVTDKGSHIIACYDEECAAWGSTVRDAWRFVKERPFVAGSFVWTGFDYRGEPTPFEWPSISTFFGTYDSCGFEKDACYLYKAFWLDEPVLHLLPHWNLEVEQGTLVKVMAFTNCEEVALYVNDRKLETKLCDEFQQVTFCVPYEPGTLKGIGYQNTKEVITTEMKTAEKAHKLCLYSSKNTLRNDGFDSVAVNVYAVDEAGNRVPHVDNLIHFAVTGGAQVIGVGNGNPNSLEADVAPTRKLFNGYAQAILLNCGSEDVIIKVTSDGLMPAEIGIPIVQTESIPYLSVINEQIVDGWTMFYKLFDEMPSPNPVVDHNDMNSFEPVSFEGNPQPQFEGQYLRFGLYRTVFNFGEEAHVGSLNFEDMKGKVWLYIDGKLIAERIDCEEGYFKANISMALNGEHTITVIIQNVDKNWCQAGICSPVIIER